MKKLRTVIETDMKTRHAFAEYPVPWAAFQTGLLIVGAFIGNPLPAGLLKEVKSIYYFWPDRISYHLYHAVQYPSSPELPVTLFGRAVSVSRKLFGLSSPDDQSIDYNSVSDDDDDNDTTDPRAMDVEQQQQQQSNNTIRKKDPVVIKNEKPRDLGDDDTVTITKTVLSSAKRPFDQSKVIVMKDDDEKSQSANIKIEKHRVPPPKQQSSLNNLGNDSEKPLSVKVKIEKYRAPQQGDAVVKSKHREQPSDDENMDDSEQHEAKSWEVSTPIVRRGRDMDAPPQLNIPPDWDPNDTNDTEHLQVMDLIRKFKQEEGNLLRQQIRHKEGKAKSDNAMPSKPNVNTVWNGKAHVPKKD
jgi:hypothetical protein